MARQIPNADATDRGGRFMGQPGSRKSTEGCGASHTRPHRRVGGYERVGRLARASSAMTLGTAIVLLAIMLALIIAFVR